MAKKGVFKKVFVPLIAVICAILFIVVVYVLYVVISYKRLPDNMTLAVKAQNEATIDATSTYKISTFNIGFGAYNQEFSFFMDTGVMKDGTKVAGKYAKAKNRDIVLANTNGAIFSSLMWDADFLFFQEVDTKSTRSRKVNQLNMLEDAFSGYSSTFAVNYKSAYLFYPFSDPIGKSNSGIATFSKYKVASATRRSLPLDTGFSKFFDLDRCIMLCRLPLDNGKELVLINVHLSAYDEGGIIRAKQLEMLNGILTTEKDAGNYIIAGGDFNHDIADTIGKFDTQQQQPDWVFSLSASDLPNGFSFAADDTAPTCRSSDIPYEKGKNYTVVIDGFIVSDNIEVKNIATIDLDFTHSDHNPVLLEFGFLAN